MISRIVCAVLYFHAAMTWGKLSSKLFSPYAAVTDLPAAQAVSLLIDWGPRALPPKLSRAQKQALLLDQALQHKK